MGLRVGSGYLQDSVSQAEAGSTGRAVEQQLVVQGGARRVRVSASEGIQHGAHRRGLGDLSPGSRGRELGLGREPWLSPNSQGKIPKYSHQQRWEAARGPAVNRLHVHLEIKLGAVPRPESLEGLHPQPSDHGVRGLRQLQGRGGPDHAVDWAGGRARDAEFGPAPRSVPFPPSHLSTPTSQGAETDHLAATSKARF